MIPKNMITDEEHDSLAMACVDEVMDDLGRVESYLKLYFGDFSAEELWDRLEIEYCNVCLKPAEIHNVDGVGECDCVCPQCGTHVFDDVTLHDHNKCRDCHKKELER